VNENKTGEYYVGGEGAAASGGGDHFIALLLN